MLLFISYVDGTMITTTQIDHFHYIKHTESLVMKKYILRKKV